MMLCSLLGSGVRGDSGALGSDYDVGSWEHSPEARSGARVRESVFWADALAHPGCSNVCRWANGGKPCGREDLGEEAGGHSGIARRPSAPKRKLVWGQGFLSLQTSRGRSHFQAFSVFRCLLPPAPPAPSLFWASSHHTSFRAVQ